MHAADRGRVVVEQAHDPRAEPAGQVEFFVHLPGKGIEHDIRGVDGIDVAADADRPQAVQAPLAALVGSLKRKNAIAANDQRIRNDLLQCGIVLRRVARYEPTPRIDAFEGLTVQGEKPVRCPVRKPVARKQILARHDVDVFGALDHRQVPASLSDSYSGPTSIRASTPVPAPGGFTAAAHREM